MSHGEDCIKKMRAAYSENRHFAFACWLDEFDDALLSSNAISTYATCQLLLNEIQQNNYHLEQNEGHYVKSRAGMFLLHMGISSHLQNDVSQADHYYQQSLTLCSAIQFADGEGRVLAARHELYSPKVDRILLTQLLAAPKVTGNSQIMLCERIKALSVSEKVDVILAAKCCKQRMPVLLALEDQDAYVRSFAATALQHMQPDLEQDKLMKMLQAPDWMQRWQALIMLKAYLGSGSEKKALYQDLAYFAIQLLCSNNELNTVVRIAMIEIMGLLGTETNILLLQLLQNETDSMVRERAQAYINANRQTSVLHVTNVRSTVRRSTASEGS